MAEAELVKGGETKISLTLHRSAEGLRLIVKAAPAIEEFFHKLSGGVQDAATVHGRMWVDPSKDNILKVYLIDRAMFGKAAEIDDYEKTKYTLEKVGQPLLERAQDRRTGEQIFVANISFLRLVGISDPAGITFMVKGVYSKDEVTSIRDRVAGALKKFYIDFMQPMDLTVMVSTQDMRL